MSTEGDDNVAGAAVTSSADIQRSVPQLGKVTISEKECLGFQSMKTRADAFNIRRNIR
ncbi:hypothetical protein JOB18_026421 [Solea senegalensis]|uniref:Uncharacterized protein n=1 Tax=Solea senegalensis TaxID=28829 RepID=A0AAV6SUW6_SOLSE|nr:hypothetical protein JOB18_026421 [Solea senegalensis]